MNRKVGCSTINTAAIRSARARKPCSRSFVFPRKRGGDPPADFVDLLPISRRQSQSARGRKEPSVFRTGFVGIVEKARADLDSLLAKRQSLLRRLCGRTLKRQTIHSPTPKIGRNDPCPCGSGKKWKRCCGA